MGGGAEFFTLGGSEDVDGDQMDLCVTVLSGLGGGHLDNLVGTVLDDDETVLPQSRALHGEGKGGTGIGALEGVLMLCAIQSVHVRWLCEKWPTRHLAGRNWRRKSTRWGNYTCGVLCGCTYLRVVRHGVE